MAEQITEQSSEVFAVLGKVVQLFQRRRDVAREYGMAQAENLPLRREAEHGKHIGLLDVRAAKTDQLIERALSVAHAAIGAAGDRIQCRFINRDVLFPCDIRELLHDE